MYDQEVQSYAFVVEASNVYRAVVVEVDIEGGLCCGSPGRRVIHRPRHKGWRMSTSNELSH